MNFAASRPAGVTIVVACFNEVNRIARCMNSLLNQDCEFDFSILVVDGGSTDGTLPLLERIRANDSRIRIVHNPQRVIAAARNIGWRQSQSEFIAYTDADCEIPPHWLRTLFDGFQAAQAEYPAVVAVGSGNVPPPGASKFYTTIRQLSNSPLGSRGTVQTKRFSEVVQVDHLPTLNVLYARRHLEQVGGFDESFAMVGEDEDLSARLREAGGVLLYIPNAIVVHWQRDNLRKWAANMFTYGLGRSHLMHRHRELRRWTNGLPLLLPAAIVLAVTAILGGFGAPVTSTLLLPLCAYGTIIAAHSVWVSMRAESVAGAPLLAATFVATHSCYVLGLLAYWLRPRDE